MKLTANARSIPGDIPSPRGKSVYDGGGENYYSAHRSKDSEWIRVRTKWSAPVGAIAKLAYEKGINVTMEFDSLDNSETGSMSATWRRFRITWDLRKRHTCPQFTNQPFARSAATPKPSSTPIARAATGRRA